MSTYRLRKQLILYSHRLDQKGFVANHDGNLSVRISSDDRFLVTPTARAKFDLKETDLITIDSSGKTRSGTGKVFGEWAFHQSIYKARKDVSAIVHAHCPYSSQLGLLGQDFSTVFWPEAVVSLGRKIPCVYPALPEFKESLEAVASASKKASACLMQGNGVFAWGASLEQAYLRLELVEHLAKIFTLATAAGSLRQLPDETIKLLLEKRKKAGLMSPEES